MSVEPATLNEAMQQQSIWLNVWVTALAGTNLASILFIIGRKSGKWIFRPEALAIIATFIASAVLMQWMYSEYGYVRLLGLAHLIFWVPAYAWIWNRRKLHPPSKSLFGKYLIAYFVMSGISLVIDFIDVIRYFIGV